MNDGEELFEDERKLLFFPDERELDLEPEDELGFGEYVFFEGVKPDRLFVLGFGITRLGVVDFTEGDRGSPLAFAFVFPGRG